MNRRLALLFVVCLCATTSHATGNGGSVYSRFGLGDLRYTGATQLFGMAGVGAAYLPHSSVNDINPAAWYDIDRVRFNISTIYEGFSTTDGSKDVYLSSLQFNGAGVAIPISTRFGITFTAGMSPYARVNYRIVSREEQSGLQYDLSYIGDGGLSRAFVGISGSLTPFLHIGAAFDYYFGTSRYTMNQDFVSNQYATTEYTLAASFKGVGSTLGVMYDGLTQILPLPFRHVLTVGASLNTTSYLQVEAEKLYRYGIFQVSIPVDTVTIPEATLKLPYSISGGISYYTQTILIATDVRYQEWDGSSVNTTPYAALSNSYRFSLGAEYLVAKDPKAMYSQKISYRLGIFYDRSYLTVYDQPITERGITAGLTMPIVGDTRISFGASYSIRGTTDYQLQKDQILRISMSLDVSELWFQRPTEE